MTLGAYASRVKHFIATWRRNVLFSNNFDLIYVAMQLPRASPTRCVGGDTPPRRVFDEATIGDDSDRVPLDILDAYAHLHDEFGAVEQRGDDGEAAYGLVRMLYTIHYW